MTIAEAGNDSKRMALGFQVTGRLGSTGNRRLALVSLYFNGILPILRRNKPLALWSLDGA